MIKPLPGAAVAMILWTAASAVPTGAAELRSVEVDGTEFKATLADGRVMRSPDLVGAVLTLAVRGQATRVRIDAVERDPDARHGEVWLHTLSAQATDGAWSNLCDPGPDGRRQAFPIAGRIRQPDQMFEPAAPGIFELTCTAGAQGKCARFGYIPWESEGMLARYNACIRLVRADYCGDGESHTRDGTLIDIYDKLGIQRTELTEGVEFEAGWGAGGAVCVRRVRIGEIYSLESLRRDCPRLTAEDVGDGCTEERVRQHPAALLMNKSRVR
jgi:hypothetical protein